ncbi:MAG: hypothetical protein LKI59_05735 [Bacteroidales bacterium]|jgi:hypothetical protein|nr:hypothetical protein [Bacteroidales bacterium]
MKQWILFLLPVVFLFSGCAKGDKFKETIYISSNSMTFSSKASSDSVYSMGDGFSDVYIYANRLKSEPDGMTMVVTSNEINWIKVIARRKEADGPYYMLVVEVSKNDTGQERTTELSLLPLSIPTSHDAKVYVTQEP